MLNLVLNHWLVCSQQHWNHLDIIMCTVLKSQFFRHKCHHFGIDKWVLYHIALALIPCTVRIQLQENGYQFLHTCNINIKQTHKTSKARTAEYWAEILWIYHTYEEDMHPYICWRSQSVYKQQNWSAIQNRINGDTESTWHKPAYIIHTPTHF